LRDHLKITEGGFIIACKQRLSAGGKLVSELRIGPAG